jgi:acetyl esterase/lipase
MCVTFGGGRITQGWAAQDHHHPLLRRYRRAGQQDRDDGGDPAYAGIMIRPALLALLPLLLTGAATPPADPPALMTWADLTKRPHPKPDATIPYGPDALQKADLWVPTGQGPHPVVVMVHGGCWQSDIADRTLMDWIAADLRDSGIAVWNIDYRGVDRAGGGYPGTFTDVGRAADQLVEQAGRYRLDLRRVVAVGHSAGGHLALWLAARPTLPADSPLRSPHPLKIDRVVSLGGLPDLEATAAAADNGCGTEVVGKLIAGGGYADTSIPRLLPLGVPQDLVNGDRDRIIPARLATGYVAAAQKAGDPVTLQMIPQTGHVELIAPETPAWAAAKRLIVAGLRR